MTPEEVIQTIERSKLRGRGGGGFDAGRKWRSCKKAGGDVTEGAFDEAIRHAITKMAQLHFVTTRPAHLFEHPLHRQRDEERLGLVAA